MEHEISDLGAFCSAIFAGGLGILFGTEYHDRKIGIGVLMVTLGVLYGITRLWWYLDDKN